MNGLRESECTVCPPWVKACTHGPDGRVLRLHDDEEARPILVEHTPELARFLVLGPAPLERCAKCGKHELLAIYIGTGFFSDEPEPAHAEYLRRQAEMYEAATS
jgi:hypothetical protein